MKGETGEPICIRTSGTIASATVKVATHAPAATVAAAAVPAPVRRAATETPSGPPARARPAARSGGTSRSVRARAGRRRSSPTARPPRRAPPPMPRGRRSAPQPPAHDDDRDGQDAPHDHERGNGLRRSSRCRSTPRRDRAGRDSWRAAAAKDERARTRRPRPRKSVRTTRPREGAARTGAGRSTGTGSIRARTRRRARQSQPQSEIATLRARRPTRTVRSRILSLCSSTMQLSTMRRVDYFVGIPLCFVLTLIVRALAVLRGPRRRHAQKDPLHRAFRDGEHHHRLGHDPAGPGALPRGRALLLHLPQERREPSPPRTLSRGMHLPDPRRFAGPTWRPTSGAS